MTDDLLERAIAYADSLDIAYWKPEPKQPKRDAMWYALLVPAVTWTLGLILYAGTAFTPDFGNGGFERARVVGSYMMVAGGEISTPFVILEVFSKVIKGEAHPWDFVGVFFSLLATAGNLTVVYAQQSGLIVPWVLFVVKWGPVAQIGGSILDFYAACMELGFYRASFGERWTKWNNDRHTWTSGEHKKAVDQYMELHGAQESEQSEPQETQGKSEETPVDQTSQVGKSEESQPQAALQKLRDYESDESQELTDEILEDMTKAERIRYLAENFPELAQVDIADKSGASESYVSRVMKEMQEEGEA